MSLIKYNLIKYNGNMWREVLNAKLGAISEKMEPPFDKQHSGYPQFLMSGCFCVLNVGVGIYLGYINGDIHANSTYHWMDPESWQKDGYKV